MPTLIGSGDLTIIDVKDGLTAKLSNESHSVPTDENGNNGDYTNCISTISIFIGSIDDTSNWAIQAVPSVGVNGSLINKTYTVTSMSNDVGTVDFVATKLGYPEIILRFTITKAKAGVTGSDGKNASQISIVAVQYDYRADDTLWGIRINDELQPTSSRGHKLVVLDPITNTVSINQNYDTYASITNADNLAAAINNIADGQIVLLTTWDASQCNQNLRNALKLCGSDSNETWAAQRKSHAFIGQKGLPIGAAYEKTGSGATVAGTSRAAAYYTTSGIVRNGSTAFNAVSAVLSNEAHIFQASNLGVVSSYVGSGTEIRVYDGTSLLSYDGVGTSTGTWKITTSTSNITVGTITDSGDFATVGNHSSVSNNIDDSLITYTITGKSLANSSFTLVKVQSFTKAKAGADAISAVLSNEAHTLQASNLGVVSSYDGSGTEIRVYDGATLLSYDGVGTATGTWKITTSTSNITVGTITDSGDFATVGNHSNMNADIAGVSYFITGKSKLGNSFSLTKTQSFAKSKTGDKGDKGDKGDTGNTGTRGTLSVSRAISGSTWTDSEALLAITAMGAEAPLPGDVVTLYNIAASFSQTRVRAASSWNVLAAFYSGDVIIDNTLSADKITSNSITATKIATDAITADKISANAITATKIATDAITADKISANAITATKIATDAITADKISANAITATKLNIGDTSNAFPDPTLAEASLTTWEILEGATADFSISNTGAGISFSEKTITILGGKASQISIQSPATRVEPNSEYFISAWCGAVDNGGFTTNSTGQLYARWFGSTGTFISETLVGQTSVTLSSQTTPSISGVVVAPNSAVTVKLKFTRLAGASNDAARFTAPTIRRAVNASLIVNGAITADAISAGAITADKISADAITTDKLSAGAITTDKLSAGAITTDKLSILSKEYVNPVSTSKNLIGWVLNDDGSGAVPSNVSYDSIENGILLTSNANHSIRSKSWEINHSKIYRVSFKIKSSDTGGTYYVGIAASTAAMTFGVSATSSQGTSSVIPYSTSRTSSSATTNPYFYSGNKSTSYVEFVCFIIGANRDINECPLHIAPGGTPFLKVDSAATHVALRFLNWSNSTVSRSMWIKDIAVTELGSGIITAENISAGAITADKISAGAISTNKLLVQPPSLCPDPYFADEGWWAGTAFDSSGWFYEAGTVDRIQVPKVATLWEGSGPPGATRKHIWSGNITAPTVGTQLRLRSVIRNLSNHRIFTLLRFYNVSGTTVGSDILVFSEPNSGLQTLNSTGVVPDTAATCRFIIYNQAGSTFTGVAYVSGVMLDVAASADLIVDGAITADKISAGAITADKISAGAITADKIDSRGLTIRDSEGNIILSAGSSLQNQINPYESGATVGANASNLTGFDDIGNLFPDIFYKNPAWGTFTGDWLVGTSSVINSAAALRYITESKTSTTNFIADKTTPTILFTPCTPGETIYISAKWATAANATGTWALIPRFYDKNKVVLSTSSEPNWLYMDVPSATESSKSWKITVPTGAAYMGYRVRRGSDGANIAAIGWCEIGQIQFSRSESGATRNVFRGDWATSTNYSIGDIVLESGYGWSCIQNHTSSSSIKPPTYPATSNTYWTAYTIKGDTGADAVVAILSNEAHVFPASSAGAVSTYSGSGTDIYVYEGANALAYDGVGTSTGTWKIATASSNITVGTITDSGSYVTIGNHSGVASGTDTSSITYTITGKTSRGASFSLTKTQTFSKSKAGVTGPQGPAVVLVSNRPASFTSTDGTLDGSQANIVFTANVSGIDSPTYAWSFSGLQTNPTASTTSTQTITAAQFGTSKSAIVTVAVNGTIVDKMTIVRLEQSTAAAGATVGATIGTNLSGQITAENASTYIANAAIGSAQIGQLKAANIEAGAISTEKLQIGSASAVNIFSSSSNALMPWGNIEAKSVQSGNVSNNAIFTTSGGNVSVAGFVRLRLYNATLPSTVANVAIATEIYFDDVYQGMGGWSTCPRLTVGSTAFSGPIIVAPFNAIFTGVPAGTHDIKIVLYVEMINSSGARQAIQPNPSVLSSIHCSMNIIEHKV